MTRDAVDRRGSARRAASGFRWSHGRATWWALGALVALGAVSSGCYRYVPVSLADVGQSEEVRVRITEEAATRLVKEFGTYTTELEGQVARDRSDSVSVTVDIGREYRGLALEGGRQVLFLGSSEVVGVRRRQLSRSRTVVVGAGTVAGIALLAVAVKQWDDPNTSVVEPPPPPPPGGRVVPLRAP